MERKTSQRRALQTKHLVPKTSSRSHSSPTTIST